MPGRVNGGDARVKVLYIAGSGRSGSTILDRILGQLDGFFSVGELCNLWDRGLLARRKCGCGVPVVHCPTWTGILAYGFGRVDDADARKVVAMRGRRVRARYIPAVLLTRWRGRDRADDELLPVLERLYRAVQQHTGCRVIVDSSKAPLYGELLAAIPAIDLRVVHLVRDPRATAFSWMRDKQLPDFGDQRLMQRQRPLKSAGLWSLWQTMSELLIGRPPARYLRLRYEDFVRDPEAAVRGILGFVGEDPPALPFVSPQAVRLAANHSVSGNPNRFSTGDIAIRADDEWMRLMPGTDRMLVTASTFPLLLRYSHPLLPPAGPARTRPAAP